MSEPDIRFTWNIHWSCNYRCTYCFFDKRWLEYAPRNLYKTPGEWLERWGAVRDRYGRAFITINGGEPFTYPRFVELVVRLSDIHWPINITTNTSMRLREFAAAADPGRVSLSLSFHPQYHTIGEFVETVTFLRREGVNLGCLNFVAYPPFLKELPDHVARLQDIGESLKVIPFVGSYRGKEYPGGYDAREKKIIGLTEEWIDGKRHKGTLCMAGARSALLLPDGKVTRCGQIGDPGIFGDFFDPDFELFPGPRPCSVEFCPCDEWKVIPDEKAPAAAGAWLP